MQNMKLSPLISEEQLKKRVQELGAALTKKFKGEDVVALGVLKGSFMFYSDLVREIDSDITCDFCAAASYVAAKSSGEVRLTMDFNTSVRGRHVIIIEDIIDTGLTMNFLQKYIESREPKSMTTVALLLKPDAMKVKCQIDDVGFKIANDFVVGYGLDYQGLYRNLPYIAQVQSIN